MYNYNRFSVKPNNFFISFILTFVKPFLNIILRPINFSPICNAYPFDDIGFFQFEMLYKKDEKNIMDSTYQINLTRVMCIAHHFIFNVEPLVTNSVSNKILVFSLWPLTSNSAAFFPIS